MLLHVEHLSSLESLKEYVVEVLCQREQLVPGAFPIAEQMLLRGDKPCGMYFSLHGPRAVIVSAIWEIERNLVLFYDSTGERFQVTRLETAPILEVVENKTLEAVNC